MSETHVVDARSRRLGRAVLFILEQDPEIHDHVVRADIDTLLLAGNAMDFATRLQGYHGSATPELVAQYARLAGVSSRDLYQRILPVLKTADVLDYAAHPDGTLSHVDEYVGLTGSVIEQTFRVLWALQPSDAELAVLHSVEIASWAPLTQAQHLDQITKRGLPDRAAEDGLRLARAIGINQSMWSADLNENVIFNPHVWGTRQVEIASFLRNLPPAERDALIGIFEQASGRPGIALDHLTASSSILTGARKVGLVQAATVKSSRGRSRTYVFSPIIQATDDTATTSEALHLRKLFVAHILFGHEQAALGFGRIQNPAVLVRSLLTKGRVGPASNISTDYHLLEAAGVVSVEATGHGDRAVLRLIKKEIVEAGLQWLTAGLGDIVGTVGPERVNLRRAPQAFVTPETDRATLPDSAASNEIMTSAIMELRKAAQRAARAESAFPAEW